MKSPIQIFLIILAVTLIGPLTGYAQTIGKDGTINGGVGGPRTAPMDKKCLPDQCEPQCASMCGFMSGSECRPALDAAQECLTAFAAKSSLNALQWVTSIDECFANHPEILAKTPCSSSTGLTDIRHFISAEGGEECNKILGEYQECLKVKPGKPEGVKECQERSRKGLEKNKCVFISATRGSRPFVEDKSDQIKCFMECREK